MSSRPCRTCGGLQRYANGKCKNCSDAAKRKWVSNNRDHVREYQRGWHSANPNKRYEKHIRREYKLTPEAWETMFAEQLGLCAICVKQPAEHVDHDHETGAVRALLCRCCNLGIGLL